MSAPFITRTEVAALMTPGDYLDAVQTAFALYAGGLAPSPPPMHIEGVGGAFHAKGAALLGERKLAVLKLNGNFPNNPARGLPTIQGVILLCDAETGSVLAILDSIEITLRRTAAASALAARYLARRKSQTLALIGCGVQARGHAEAFADLFELRNALVWDQDTARAEGFAAEMTAALGFPFAAASSLREATRGADIIVTATTARSPVLHEQDVPPGAFIAAVGADNPSKAEIAPKLMAKAKVVVDVLWQCVVMGDLHHAIAASAMTESDVHAELGEIVLGRKQGRVDDLEIIIFDSTGAAFQDAVSAALVFERWSTLRNSCAGSR